MHEFTQARHEVQDYLHGIRHNVHQFVYQLLQVLLVGLTIGMMRTVVPALASAEFGVPKGSFMLLISFVVAFGFVKGTLNFVAGRLSEQIGRKRVLLIGWLSALPIPFMILWAPSWGWIVAANLFLGVNQGLAWSMTVVMKIDLVGPRRRGLALGLNEALRKFPVSERVYWALLTLLALGVALIGSAQRSFIGMNRYFLVAPPLFFATAMVLRRRPVALGVWLAICAWHYWNVDLCVYVAHWDALRLCILD